MVIYIVTKSSYLNHMTKDGSYIGKFYSSIHRFLNKEANIILVENSEGSTEKDFINMISEGGLKYVGIIRPDLEDIILASYITIKGLKYDQNLPKAVEIVRRLPYNVYKFAFKLGVKLHYQLLTNYIISLTKFYFIWSKI